MPPKPSKKRATMNGAVNVRGQDDACCGVFFLKYVLVIFNCIFWISGVCVLAVAVWTLYDKHTYAELLPSMTYEATTYLLAGTGIIIIIIGFIGCVGAAKEIRTLLYVYAGFLVLVFLLELISGILAYVYHATIHAELEKSLYDTLTESYKSDGAKTKAIDDLQQSFRCCGAKSYTDWLDSKWLRNYNDVPKIHTPDSCCKSMSKNCALDRDHPSNINTEGCGKRLELYIKGHLIILGAVGLGLCCLQIFGIVFACCLAGRLQEYHKRQEDALWQ